MFDTGNSHDAAGLWQDSVPTLLEYNPLMTPPYFVFMRTFFTEPADRQIRNILATRRIDPRLLAAIGVRFVVTDAPFTGQARLRQTIDIPVSKEMLARISMQQPIPSFTLYLYELDNVNVGQYSPTEVRIASTASESLDLLADRSLDLARTAIAGEDVGDELVAAQEVEFTVDPGHFTVKATSVGRSLLVLPLEYSRCLRLRAYGADAAKVRIFRADLLMTAILFEKQLDARLAYRSGPFSASGCRVRDARDMDNLEIENAFEHHPELIPLPVQHY
jgi:hypothetical protein